VLPGAQFVEHHAERVQIGLRRDRSPWRPLLGGHVHRRTRGHDAGRAGRHGDAEVGDAHPPVLVHEDVGRLQIAMQHAFGVGRVQAGTELAGDLDHPAGRQTPGVPQHRREVLTLDELHREEHLVVGFADVEDAHYGGMRDATGEPHFLEESLSSGLAGGPNQLQGDRRLEHEIVGAPHVAHPALPEPRDHPVPHPEHEPGRKRAGRRGFGSRGGRRQAGGVDLVKPQERFDLLPQGRVAAAGICQKGDSLRPLALERGDEEILGTFVQRRHAFRGPGPHPSRPVEFTQHRLVTPAVSTASIDGTSAAGRGCGLPWVSAR